MTYHQAFDQFGNRRPRRHHQSRGPNMRPIPQSVIDQADMLILAALQGEMLSLLTGLSPNQQTPTALCSLMRFIALQQAAGAQARKGCHARH